MKYAIVFVIIGLVSQLQVAAQGWQWQHNLLTNSDDNFNAMACDNDGNVFVGVQFNNLLQIGSFSFQTNPIEDVCVVKYDSLGNVLWAQAFGGLYWDQINGMACDSAGNVFVVGHFFDELFYYDTSVVGSTGRDIFIMRINADGTFGWIQTGSNIWDEEATDVVVTAQGDIIVSGAANNTSIIAGMELISDVPDVYMQEFIAKFSNDGTPLWIRSAGATDYSSSTYSRSCLALGPDGSIHLGIPRSGGLNFAGQISEGPGVLNTAILKWDAEGNPVWGWIGLSDGNDFLRDITVDNQGRVYSVISTVMSSTFGGQPYTVVPGDWGMVFIRLLPDGTEDRFWLATGNRRSDVFAMVHTADNHIWLGGMQRHITYFPFGALFAGTVDDRQGFICEFNADTDQFEELSRVHGSGWQYIYGGCANQSGKLYFGGDMSGSMGAPVNFGMQNEIVDNMYINGLTLPFLARYNAHDCTQYEEVITSAEIQFCQGSSAELYPDIPLYGWLWMDGSPSSLLVSSAGDISIQAIGLEGCIVRDTVAIELEVPPQLNWILQPISCADAGNGVISMEAFGSNPPYSFTWNGIAVQSPLEGIEAGQYLLQAQSSAGCSTTAEIVMLQPDPLEIAYAMNYNEVTGLGSIVIESITGGTPPYTTYWPAQPQATDSLSGIVLGNYTLQVSDANDCMQEFELELTTSVRNDFKTTFKCFPLPALDEVMVQSQQPFTWSLLGSTGELLMSEDKMKSQHVLNVSSFTAGTYILRTKDSHGFEHAIQLVKQ
jgi:hypothetical protein